MVPAGRVWIWLVIAAGGLGGAAMALFWPFLMSWVSGSYEGLALNRRLGRYNGSWSSGGVVGPLVGAWLVEQGPLWPMVAAVVCFVASFLLLGLARKTQRCGMRNAECGIDPLPYSAIRNPQSAIRRLDPGRQTRGLSLDVQDRPVLCLGLVCDCPVAVRSVIHRSWLHRVAVRRVPDDGCPVQLPGIDRRGPLGVLAFPCGAAVRGAGDGPAGPAAGHLRPGPERAAPLSRGPRRGLRIRLQLPPVLRRRRQPQTLRANGHPRDRDLAWVSPPAHGPAAIWPNTSAPTPRTGSPSPSSPSVLSARSRSTSHPRCESPLAAKPRPPPA